MKLHSILGITLFVVVIFGVLLIDKKSNDFEEISGEDDILLNDKISYDFSQILSYKTTSIELVKRNKGDLNPFSKIGGMPHVVSDFIWPLWEKKPQSFLAQIDLNELKINNQDSLLPADGILYFFYDQNFQTWGSSADDKGSWKVIYSSIDAKDTSAISVPDGLSDESIFDESYVEFKSKESYPPWESNLVQALNLDDKAIDRYIDYIYELDGDSTITKLLGYPNPIQGNMSIECELTNRNLSFNDIQNYNEIQRKELSDASNEWMLLFQLDSEEDNAMMWGDCGRLYFWIKKSDLIAREFENVWMIFQCY